MDCAGVAPNYHQQQLISGAEPGIVEFGPLEPDLREEFFFCSSSDYMSFEQILMQQGGGDLVKPLKMADGGAVEMVRGDPNYFKDLL